MLEVQEEDLDRITALFYRVLKGELPQPLDLPEDYPENEVRQIVEYANRFVAEYQTLAGAMSAMSRGDLDLNVPAGKMLVVQSFKNLHANLRHLTWKTQQIAGGDLEPARRFHGGLLQGLQQHDAVSCAKPSPRSSGRTRNSSARISA